MTTIEGTTSPAREPGSKRIARAIARRWPAFAGAAVALLTILPILRQGSLTDVAAVVTASVFMYLGAAALGLRWSAWPIFGVSFVLITVSFFVPGLNPSWIMIAIAVVLIIYGLARGRGKPAYGLPLQIAALVILGTLALIAASVQPEIAAVLIAAGLFPTPGGISTTTGVIGWSSGRWPSSASSSTRCWPSPCWYWPSPVRTYGVVTSSTHAAAAMYRRAGFRPARTVTNYRALL